LSPADCPHPCQRGATRVRGSWDASESRRNSFPEAEQEALERIATPLAIEVHLAPSDPRRQQLERQAFAKLERAMPHVRVAYVSRTSSGLYEQADPYAVREPEGTLHTKEAKYEVVDEHRTRVSGSRWEPATQLTVNCPPGSTVIGLTDIVTI